MTNLSTLALLDARTEALMQDPYSPYGPYKSSYEALAQRAQQAPRGGAERALWLMAARHWRQVAVQRGCLRETRLEQRAKELARLALLHARFA